MTSPRTITITVADYQRLEQKWLIDLATARRESVVFERRIGELEAMLDDLQAEHDKRLAAMQDLQKIHDRLNREGIET